jgi:hypothetical protein
MRRSAIFLLAALIIPAGQVFSHRTADAAIRQDNYQTYNNARFAYSVSYPSDVFTPQGEADNGDGQRFMSRDGHAALIVYGSHNALGQTLRGAYSEASSRTREHPRHVTYRTLGRNWFVVSGTEGGRIFYQKTILVNGIFKTVRLEYDEAQRNIYNPITTRIVRSFRG